MTLRQLRRRITAQTWYVRARGFLTPPRIEGTRLTAKRLLNLYLQRYEYASGHTTLRAYPTRLTVEPANMCNLRCPGCFTGLGEVGRERSFMKADLYRRLLDELGDYLFEIEFYNWGEPLLNKNVYMMIEEANRRGIGTVVSTNFSLPFDSARAARLVASGLAILGVALDGASQRSYERYRRGGNLTTALENCRLMGEAKKKLHSSSPRIVWEFHVFEHNAGDIERARTMARELNMDIAVSKGWVTGPDWTCDSDVIPDLQPASGGRFPCVNLWDKIVVNNDGGVAPCCGAFYREDDFGRIRVEPEDAGASTLREVWNNWSYQEARRLFQSRSGSEASRRLICFECPSTVMWHSYKDHLSGGGDSSSFEPGYSENDGFNFFLNRGKGRARAASATDAIDPHPS